MINELMTASYAELDQFDKVIDYQEDAKVRDLKLIIIKINIQA